MDELRALTEAGNYTLIRKQKLGCFLRVEDYEVVGVLEDGTLHVGKSGAYPAYLHGPHRHGIEKGAILDVEGILVSEGYSLLHIWVRSVEVTKRGPSRTP